MKYSEYIIIFNHRIVLSLIVGMLAFMSSSVHATKMYKWVDANGNVSYQDRPPPETAKILDERELEERPSESEEIDTDSEFTVKTDFAGDPVIVYVVDGCERCDLVIKYLRSMGVSTNERELKDYRDAQSEIIRVSGGITAPTLFINEGYVIDSSEENINKALIEAGYIQRRATTQDDQPDPALDDSIEKAGQG